MVVFSLTMSTEVSAEGVELYVEITTVCQLQCTYCFYETSVGNRQKPPMQVAELMHLFASGLHRGVRSVTFTGGEVLLHRSFWAIVAAARDAGLRVNFITDGLLLCGENLEKLATSGTSRVAISLDSLVASENDSVRRPKSASTGGARSIVRNICALVDRAIPGLDVVLMQTVHRKNVSSVRSMLWFADWLGVSVEVHPVGLPHTVELTDLRLDLCTPDELRELEEVMLEWAGQKPRRRSYVETSMKFIGGHRPDGLTCTMGVRSLFLNSQGVVHPCFHRTDVALGSALTDSFSVIMDRGRTIGLSSAPCATLACACLLGSRD